MNETVRTALRWLSGRDTGISSRTICFYLLIGEQPADHSYPLDPADLGRCIRLLDAIPEFRRRLPEMANVSPVWAAIVDEWDELERLYREEEPSGTAPRCYKAMQRIIHMAEGRRET